MNIVIPTHEPHRKHNIDFLKSFDEFCVDKKDVTITLVVNSHNFHSFYQVKEGFKDLKVQVVTLSNLMENVDGVPGEDHPSTFFHKYPLQSMKKLFAFSVVDSDYIVMDSENLCLKRFEFSKIFEKLKQKPILFCNKIFFEEVQSRVVDECNFIVNSNLKKWCFLKSYWFFEKKLVSDMVNEIKMRHGSVSLFLRNKFFFDYQLYCTYLHEKKLRNFACIDDVISKEPYNFLQLLDEKQNNFEYVCTVLNENNVLQYCNLIDEMDEKIVRLHWMPDNVRGSIIKNSNMCIGTFL